MNLLRNRRYDYKVFFSIMIILFIFTSSLVTSIYYNMKSYVSKMEDNKSELILSQMKYNFEYMGEMIRDICLSVYYSSDAKVLMYFDSDETYNEMSLVNRLNTLKVRGNSLIHSIHVYNNKKKVLYSTYHSFISQDKGCTNIIRNTYPLPVLKPVMRTFHDELTGMDTTILSYFMYELTDSNHVMDGGVIINVNVEWLMRSLNELNAINNKDDKIYIYSLTDGIFLGSANNSKQSAEMPLIKQNINFMSKAWKDGNLGSMSSFEIKVDGSDYLVYYEILKDTDWMLVKVQSFLTLKEYFKHIYITLLSIAAIALVLAALVYYLISRRLYKPVKNIMNMIPKDNASEAANEFEIIHNTFEHYSQELNLLKSKYNSYTEIAKSFFLRRLLLDSLSVTPEDVDEAKKKYQISIDVKKPLSIYLIKINGYKDLASSNVLHDVKLAKFVVQNISNEIIGNQFPCEHIDMDGDYFVMVQNSVNRSQKEMAVLLKEIQYTCLSPFNLSLAITISAEIQDYTLLTDLYNKTVYNSNYRLIFGNHSIIYDEFLLNMKLSDDTGKVYKMEDELIADINEPMEIILGNINMLFDELKKLEYYSVIFSIVRLQKMVIDVINDVRRRYPDSAVEYPYILNFNIIEDNSLDDIKEEIITIITEIRSKQLPDAKQNKSGSIALEVKKMIDNEYSNIDLNASKISDAMKISASKLSSIFNRYMNMTIPEYLNTVRLQKAVELLKHSDYSITAIMQMIGTNNESYFYRLFKNKYKMTPREYAMVVKEELVQ
jgi:AraC-like DNA-binding protein